MKLHKDKKLFKQAIQYTSDELQMLPIYIEKDYWVTFALYTIFNDKIGEDTVFKGGTSLSKCFNIIERFSEDIDLVILRRENESNSQLTKKIKKISAVVKEVLPEINIEGLTRKMGMNRKTAHSYNKEFNGNYGQVRDAIIVEATWLGYFEPYTNQSICSFVGEMMLRNKQNEIAERNGLLPFEVLVLEPTRTLCEKIMSLVRFSYGENPITDLKNKIRHIYDLHQLLQNKEYSIFFNSLKFEEMLLKVANDDVISFKNNNKWLEYHPINAVIFNDLDEVWNELKPIYEGDFRYLVYGDLPDTGDLLNSLKIIKKRLVGIEWSITIKR